MTWNDEFDPVVFGCSQVANEKCHHLDFGIYDARLSLPKIKTDEELNKRWEDRK